MLQQELCHIKHPMFLTTALTFVILTCSLTFSDLCVFLVVWTFWLI